MVGFNGILDTGWVEDQEMMKNKLINGKVDEKVVSRFRSKLVKMIKNAGSKDDDYSISSKIRQILLHWGYELTEKDFFVNSKNQCIKMSS